MGIRVTRKIRVGYFGFSKIRVFRNATRNLLWKINTRHFGYPKVRVRVRVYPICLKSSNLQAAARRCSSALPRGRCAAAAGEVGAERRLYTCTSWAYHAGAGEGTGATRGAAGDTGSARVKASRPLIRVLVINDNGLWINNFIWDNEYRLIHGWKRFGCERMEFWRW